MKMFFVFLSRFLFLNYIFLENKNILPSYKIGQVIDIKLPNNKVLDERTLKKWNLRLISLEESWAKKQDEMETMEVLKRKIKYLYLFADDHREV